MQKKIDCRYFLDNQSLCFLEIATPLHSIDDKQKNYEWLLFNKIDQSIKMLSLKSRDESTEVQERYFNLGFLKFSLREGVFIETGNKGQYRLENKACEGIPEEYMQTIENFLNAPTPAPLFQSSTDQLPRYP